VPDCDPADFTVGSVPKRFAEIGDPHAEIDAYPGSLEKLLDSAARDEANGVPDAPWPPHFRKGAGEAKRVSPSRARTGRSKMPLVVVAKSADMEEALAGLDRWKARHRSAAKFLNPEDILVDSMRGRSSTWTRIRVNLQNVPEKIRPTQEAPDPDRDPTRTSEKLRQRSKQ